VNVEDGRCDDERVYKDAVANRFHILAPTY
jgi:hypothetical protein